jgi:hypothetical protein
MVVEIKTTSFKGRKKMIEKKLAFKLGLFECRIDDGLI